MHSGLSKYNSLVDRMNGLLTHSFLPYCLLLFVLLEHKYKNIFQVSRLVVSEIVRRTNSPDRVACIEKWAAIADICRCMHNYNGVLQICAAFVNSSVFRLKKTWDKVPKQVCQYTTKDITIYIVIRNMSSRFSSNSEAFAS